jgi:hypothetical protein
VQGRAGADWLEQPVAATLRTLPEKPSIRRLFLVTYRSSERLHPAFKSGHVVGFDIGDEAPRRLSTPKSVHSSTGALAGRQ